ncbi:DEAD/DEAH box helicase [Rhodococcus sp. MEB064]|uniref:DEAD/DEAH box helicase n=1 Tax=Rhodococcus sp. MEB064 TaxID=1587522 RepID=UPI0005ACE4AB|nr:DEAD/DEAH box helicase [Rhodococcus sp. MEB064]KIQ15073.1 helicase [Rhodococcus sp. MEB064]
MLHGLWTPGSGLMLWEDDVAAGGSDEAGELPPYLAKIVSRRMRHRANVTLPSPGGHTVVSMPAVALAPVDAAEALLRVPTDHRGISGDLRYLAVLAAGVERWVRAGRVVPRQTREDSQWWTRWTLVGGEPQRAWRAELAAAMPPVQSAEGGARAVLDDILTEITDPVVRRVIGRPDVEHPLLVSLVEEEPYEDGSARSEAALEQWRASLRSDEPDLLLRLTEPEDDGEENPLWPLEVLLRAEGEAPRHVVLHRGSGAVEGGIRDAESFRVAVAKLGEAMAAYEPLRGMDTDPGSLDMLLPTEAVTDFVLHGVEKLRAASVGVLLPRAWSALDASLRLKVDTPPSPTAENRAVGLDEIVAYDWQLAIGDMVLTPEEMARLSSSKGDLVRLRGKWVQADGAVLGRAIEYVKKQNRDRSLPLAAVLGQLSAEVPPPLPVEEIVATGWAEKLLDPDRRPEPVEVPASVDATLRPYQQRGVEWLAFMSSAGLGAVLADDMGLGKTLQLLVLLAHERVGRTDADGSPTLLVAPMSVVGNWQREAAKFVPGLRVYVHHGPDRASGEEFAAAVRRHDLVVTTYALLARDVAELSAQTWRRMVLDEAQHIKNSNTAQARAARAVPAAHRIALTGTPVENRLDELRSIFDFCNPGILGSVSTFRARFAVPIEREKDEGAVARLRSLTSPFVLRRVKTDKTVIADLPDKFEMTVRSNLTSEQAGLYQAVVDEMMRQISETEGMARKGAVLGALTRLKQVCNHPAHFLDDGSTILRRGKHRSGKLALVDDILDSVLGDGEKALLFTQFTAFGSMVAPYLERRFGVPVPFLHGGVSKGRRDAMVEQFQTADGPPIMLLSLKAGGTGLNLTAANHVVHLDRWWNPAVENQATDRAFRIGQRKDVQVRKLLCVGTVEERIDAMLTTKKDLADLAVGSGESWITELSTGELRDLLTLSEDAVGD